MKGIIMFFLFLSVKSTAQGIITKEMVSHLVQAGELSPANNWKDAIQKISVSKIFETENQGIFCFSTTFSHGYYFLLLKNRDTFQILNCDNFIDEFDTMDSVLKGVSRDSFSHYLMPIIRLYQHNYRYHPTPPIPDLRAKKGEKVKSYYFPRKLPSTKPFIYVKEF